MEVQARVERYLAGALPHALVAIYESGEFVQHVRAGREVILCVAEDRDLDADAFTADISEACGCSRELQRREHARVSSLFPLTIWEPV